MNTSHLVGYVGTSSTTTICPSYTMTASPPGATVYYASTTPRSPVPKMQPVLFPCPKCHARAIASDSLGDLMVELHDHEREPGEDGRIVTNGTVARIRVCSACGHLWATIKREIDA